MLEVFWIVGAVQFAVAAGIEFQHMLERRLKNLHSPDYDL
jgi:hypothetical protein